MSLLKMGSIASTMAFLLLRTSPAIAQEPTPTPIPEPETTPLIEGRDLLILLLVVVGLAMLLLGLMVWTIGRNVIRATSSGNREAYLTLVQGMVLVTVVVAVILLGVSGKITQEGLASILAAIVGFAVGRASAPSGGAPSGEEQTLGAQPGGAQAGGAQAGGAGKG